MDSLETITIMPETGKNAVSDVNLSSDNRLDEFKTPSMMDDGSQSQKVSMNRPEESNSAHLHGLDLDDRHYTVQDTESNPRIIDNPFESAGRDTGESDDEDFLRLRAKVRELKFKAKDILQIQALKAEYIELEQMLGGQIDQKDQNVTESTQHTAEVLTSIGVGDRYRDESFDYLYHLMPDKYRRKTNWKSYDNIQSVARSTALKARASPFLDGYFQQQVNGDDLAYNFTRRKLQARYSYEREMEYLYAVQERYDAMRAEKLERENQQQVTKQLARERQENLVAVNQHSDKTSEHEVESSQNVDKDHASLLEDAHAREDDPEPVIPKSYAMPEIHYSDWGTFRAMRNRGLEASFVIEVLVGEPMITYDLMGIPTHRRPLDKNEDASKDRKGAVKSLNRGQGALPERIRIRSEPLLAVLTKITEQEPIGDWQGVAIMTRPFKALAYYEKKLRSWYEGLAKRHYTFSAREHEPDESRSGYESEGETEEEWDKIPNPLATLQHLSCLINFIDKEIIAKIEYLENETYQQATFAEMWYLFKPGDKVIDQHSRQAYRVLSVTSPGHKAVYPWAGFYNRFNDYDAKIEPMLIRCVYVDFDGKTLGPVVREFEIEAFDGEKSISSLPIQPFRFSKSSDLQSRLIERGKKFAAMTSVKHMHCSGVTLDTRDEVDGQVVIDFAEALSVPENKSWRPEIRDLVGDIPQKDSNDECSAECCRDEHVHDDSYVDDLRNEDFMATLNPQGRSQLPSVAIHPWSLEDLGREENVLTDEEFMIMSNRVFGYILRSRKWAAIDLADLVDIHQIKDHSKETAFDKLVLPDGHKQMIQSLIAQHFRDKESGNSRNEQVDFVRGKGKGLILLLHGAPGVGKTSTAECVAELFRKPLFQITCGDLGTTAKDVETTMETNFSLANRWGCILLLDEADVFLAARSPTDFTRNGLVAVFLRVLEYYAGILFLTTNRVGDFDEAFASRIHISLYYPPLELESMIKVFQLNFAMIRDRFQRKERKLHIDHRILEYATQHYYTNQQARWNGRQVRNACQTALALAEFEAQGGKHDAVVDASAEVRLEVKHFKIVTDAYLEFTHYLRDIFGIFADQRAQEQNLRAKSDISGYMNPLSSYNNNGGQTAPFTQPPSTALRGYPQYTSPLYHQNLHGQQITPGAAYHGQGSAGNPTSTQNMPQQVPQAWSEMSVPRIHLGGPASLNITGFPQQASTSPGIPGYIHNPPNMPSTEYQLPPGDT